MERAHTLAVALRRPAGLSWVTLALPALSGGLFAATYLDFALFPLAWIAYVPFLWSLEQVRTRREAVWLGAIAGLATNVPGFYWLVYTMHVFGGFPIPIAVFFYACLSSYSALQFVFFAVGVRALGFGFLGLSVPVVWTAIDFLYPNLFPWHLANSQFHWPMVTQIGDVTGTYGLSFVIMWVNAGIALAIARPRGWHALAAAGAATAVVLVYGAVRMPVIQAAIDAAPVVRVGLVQGNVGIYEKDNVSLFDINVDKYRHLSAPLQERVDVIIWPESVSQWWVPTTAKVLGEKVHPFPGLSTFLIYGGLAYDPRTVEGRVHPGAKFNSAFLIDPQGRVLGRYDKQVLLPFGEYLPGTSLFPQLADLSPQTGDFTPGDKLNTLDIPGLARVAPLVCYEDVPTDIARAMTRHGAEVLLTIFNDAWFGRSAAAYEHEALALWRAIENRRYFLRVGNAGVTGIIDPFGRVVDRLGQYTEEVLEGEFRPLRLQTLYTRFGDVFAWMIVAWAAVLFVRHYLLRNAVGRSGDQDRIKS